MDPAELTQRYASSCGVVTRLMLLADGVPPVVFDRWVRTGVLRHVAGKGYVHTATPITVLHRCIAAHLTWPDAIICLTTAALVHGFHLDGDDDGVVHVLVPDGRKAVTGIQPRRWSVRPTDVTIEHGFPMTDRLTTLADCLGRLPADDAWGLLAWMWTRDDVTIEEIEAQIEERWHLYGVVRLRRMAMAVRRGALSEGEIALHEFLASCGFVGWAGDQIITNAYGRIVARADVLFLEEHLIIEYDGLIAHGDDAAAADQRRDEMLTSLGYVVIHVRWWQVHAYPRILEREIAAAIEVARSGADDEEAS